MSFAQNRKNKKRRLIAINGFEKAIHEVPIEYQKAANARIWSKPT